MPGMRRHGAAMRRVRAGRRHAVSGARIASSAWERRNAVPPRSGTATNRHSSACGPAVAAAALQHAFEIAQEFRHAVFPEIGRTALGGRALLLVVEPARHRVMGVVDFDHSGFLLTLWSKSLFSHH